MFLLLYTYTYQRKGNILGVIQIYNLKPFSKIQYIAEMENVHP